jgi:hypothetical protein
VNLDNGLLTFERGIADPLPEDPREPAVLAGSRGA